MCKSMFRQIKMCFLNTRLRSELCLLLKFNYLQLTVIHLHSHKFYIYEILIIKRCKEGLKTDNMLFSLMVYYCPSRQVRFEEEFSCHFRTRVYLTSEPTVGLLLFFFPIRLSYRERPQVASEQVTEKEMLIWNSDFCIWLSYSNTSSEFRGGQLKFKWS